MHSSYTSHLALVDVQMPLRIWHGTLSSFNTADKERAVSMLSSLTLFLEYHSAMMKAGVFPALIKAILDARMVPQVTSLCAIFTLLT